MSACLTRGAYTTVLNGRMKQKRRATIRVTPRDVASEAKKEPVASYKSVREEFLVGA